MEGCVLQGGRDLLASFGVEIKDVDGPVVEGRERGCYCEAHA